MLVFVYGSLKLGFNNHVVLEHSDAEFKDVFITKPEYTMYSLGMFPGVVKDGDTTITGELYEVEELDRLDSLEGYPDYYTREEIDTPYGKAWIYLFNGDTSTLLEVQGGCW